MTATDGLLSMGDATGESVPGKMLWYRDWQFMYAGLPANFFMVNEEIERTGMDDPEALSRRRVQETVRRSYQRVRSRLSSFESLSPYDLAMDEFKETGLKTFGEEFHGQLLQSITHRSSLLDDQMLVCGWGHSPHSVMIYEIGPSGDWLHTAAGFAAIGSGAQMAQTMLLLLGQARHRTLAETLFNVACAKFSSEKSSGQDVGKMTTMFVARKRTDDDKSDTCGEFVEFSDMEKLRSLWEGYLRPRIPDEARGDINRISARVNGGKIAPRDMFEQLSAVQRIQASRLKIYEEVKATISPDPQSTTMDQSHPQPSPESPGEIDES